jgi:hypothetical protein
MEAITNLAPKRSYCDNPRHGGCVRPDLVLELARKFEKQRELTGGIVIKLRHGADGAEPGNGWQFG